MSSKETILITGANGFIGGWLAEVLYLQDGSHVRAGIHSWQGAVRLARFPIEIVLCDILNQRQVEEAMDGASCVIHCAKGGSRASITEGTQYVLEAAQKQGIRRFVHLSTAEVYGGQNGVIDETAPLQKTGNAYGDAKIDAEQLCWDYHARGLPVTVIRPSIVYGPFSKTWSVGIALKLQSGNWGVFRDHGDGICNLIYVADLVSAILMAARDERAAGEAFNLNGCEAPTWNQYFQRFNSVIGLPELQVIEPASASLRAAIMEPVRTSAKFARDHFQHPIRKVAALFGPARRLMQSVERTMKTAPRSTDFDLYNRKALYLPRKAEDILGFQPRFDLDAGLEMTVAWLKQLGLVN